MQVLTDAQWAILEPLIPSALHGGRPREVDMREIVNAMLYLNRTGCQWDMLPHDLPPKSSVAVPPKPPAIMAFSMPVATCARVSPAAAV